MPSSVIDAPRPEKPLAEADQDPPPLADQESETQPSHDSFTGVGPHPLPETSSPAERMNADQTTVEFRDSPAHRPPAGYQGDNLGQEQTKYIAQWCHNIVDTAPRVIGVILSGQDHPLTWQLLVDTRQALANVLAAISETQSLPSAASPGSHEQAPAEGLQETG